MITGAVKADEARIRLQVRGHRGREQEVEAVIDSGYSGALTLPLALITALGLRWRSVDRATLADGSTCVFQVYTGKVLWDGKVRTIGCSNFSAAQVAEALAAAKQHGVNAFVSCQDQYNLLSREIERELIPTMQAQGQGRQITRGQAIGIVIGCAVAVLGALLLRGLH